MSRIFIAIVTIVTWVYIYINKEVMIFFFFSVTIVSGIIMALLFLSELNDYLTPELTEELLVDTSRGPKLRINLDIVFPHISCTCKYAFFSSCTCKYIL